MKRLNNTSMLLSIGMMAAAVYTVLAYDLTKEQITYEPPNTHMDTQWMWDLKQTITNYLPPTMDGNFAYFTQYPEYKFNFEGAFRYWLMKKNYATKYETLKQYVASGQWCVSGSGVEAGDVNLPSAEGLIRNYLYGEEYFMDEFGKKSLDIYLADCFGFGFVLPTVATHCGLIGFSSYKYDAWGGWITTPFPIGKWYGVDSSFVVACLKPGGYESGIDIRTADGDWLKAHSGTPGVWATYDYIGWGDQGGAPHAADVSGMITRIRANASNTIKVYCTSSDQFYRDLTPDMTAQFPSYSGELLMSQHGTGTYTSWAQMKLKNRKNEQRAMLAEFADVTANWISNGAFAYPQDTIWHAWWRVIACTMHDQVTGTSMPSVYTQYCLPMEDSSYNDFTYAMNLGNNAVANSSTQQLATTVSEAGRVPLVLVNALARSRCDVVEATVNFGAAAPAGVKVFDPNGTEVPSQLLSATGQNVSIAFVAKVPSASYSVYEVKPTTAANPANPNLKASASSAGAALENDYYQVAVNATGDISGILDKKTGKQLLSAPSRFELRSDSGTNYPAWEIAYPNVSSAPTGYVDQATAMTVAENGPARVSLKIVRTKNNSTFTHYVTLAADSAGSRVDVRNTINWLTTGTLLKASFPLTCANPKATWDLGIGTVQRGNMNFTMGNNFPCTACKGLYEVPGHQWADMTATDGTYGVSILNDCKYGWNKPSDGVLNLTLIHSPTNPQQYPADQSSAAGVGQHNFTYSIYGHAGSWTNGTVDQGERLNQPIFAFQPSTPGAGKFGKVISLVRTSTPQVAVMAIKKAEKSANYIIRVRETQGAAITGAKLTFPSTSSIVAASEVNGLEEPKGAATFSGSDLTFNLTKFQPKAFSVQLGTPVAVNGKFGDLVPHTGEVTLTVVLASDRSIRTEMRLPYGAKIRTLSITDALGRVVRNLAQDQSATHARMIVWDGKDMNSQRVRTGVYFVRCMTDQGHWTGRMPVEW